MKPLFLIGLAALVAQLGACSLTLDLTPCEVDEDCEAGLVCTEEQLCRAELICDDEVEDCDESPSCSSYEDCEEGFYCNDEQICEPEETSQPDCEGHQDCPGGDQLCSPQGDCVDASTVSCTTDDDCGAVLICESASCVDPPRCDELGGRVALMWSDFEDPEFTNVEGFREPIDEGVVPTDLAEQGRDQSTVLRLDYEVTEAEPMTGYRLFAFPAADVTAYDHLVIRARADQPRSMLIELRDDEVTDPDGIAYASTELDTLWREYLIPLSDFYTLNNAERPLNLEILQAINLRIVHDPQAQQRGTIFVDHVGFVSLPDRVEGPDLLWSDFDIKDYTNVEGYREPINARTQPQEFAGAGADGTTVLSLTFETSDIHQSTGYRMFAFPHADVSDQTAFVMRARALRPIYNLQVEFYDHRHLSEGMSDVGVGLGTLSVGPQWEWVVLPLDTLEMPEEIEELPDFSVLQLVSLVFEDQAICPATGELEIDIAGFVAYGPSGH